MSRNFMIILALVIIALVGVFVATGGKDDTGGGNKVIENPRSVQADDFIKGGANASVTLIEYGDFECPGCGALFPLLQQASIDYEQELEIVFRHFPLVTIHANAMAAHRAAQAAANQGMFWEMHDLLFGEQQAWSGRVASQTDAISIFESYAQQLGLDVDQFNIDVGSGEVADFINAHMNSGNELGITGTPSLLLQGEEIDTPANYVELTAIIDAAIAEAAASSDDNSNDGSAPESTEPTSQEETGQQ